MATLSVLRCKVALSDTENITRKNKLSSIPFSSKSYSKICIYNSRGLNMLHVTIHIPLLMIILAKSNISFPKSTQSDQERRCSCKESHYGNHR